MSKTNFLKDLASKLSEAVPTHLSSLKKDFEKNCHHILAKTFSSLDIVTREQFDIQTKVLARTRQKLEDLEKQLKELENTLKNHKSRS